MATFGQKFRGSLDLALLFGRGIRVFEGEGEGTKQAALRSLWIPVLLYPFSMWLSYYYPPYGMHNGEYSHAQVALTVTGAYVLALGAAMAFGLGFAYALGQRARFWLFFQASNWVSLPLSLLTVPIALMMVYDIMPREEMDRIVGIVTIYSVVVAGCVAYRSFRVPWELAGALACLSLFVNQQAWNVMFYMQDIDLVW
ncbi:MAG TPA: hypothetical protein PLW48_11345 [Alphaproteobacteria bacterium]|nr:hypothetical protein [Alphaproteobacteria bacterium]HCS22136.1 hypothetical protein [Rhodospirillaceae bacterium]HRI76141.1 hypothetical protein [Alphaproteobacteria bacterium]HRJ67721.1 hypothetical protein [Alphaproteobacteria bacterium]